MVSYDDVNYGLQLVAQDRAARSQEAGYPISDVSAEEYEQAHRWADGIALKGIIDTDGYQIILGKLNKQMDDLIALSMQTDRTNKDAVWANTIAAQIATQIFQSFKNDIAADLSAAEDTPDIVKHSIRLARGTVPNIKS